MEAEEQPVVHLLQSEQLIAVMLPPVPPVQGVVLVPELGGHVEWHDNWHRPVKGQRQL